MEIKIEVPAYSKSHGCSFIWEDGFIIETKFENGVICLSANKEGLISLANHLLNLAQEEVPSGQHLHLDQYHSLEVGSLELIIEKKEGVIGYVSQEFVEANQNK